MASAPYPEDISILEPKDPKTNWEERKANVKPGNVTQVEITVSCR